MFLPRRIVAITVGLTVAGAIVGFLCGAIAGAMVILVDHDLRSLASIDTLGALRFTGLFGAAAGAVGLPLLAWGLLRRVPLGLALLATAIGTIGGAAVGQLLDPFNPYNRDVPGVILGGFVGFLIAGIALRVRTGRRAPSGSSK